MKRLVLAAAALLALPVAADVRLPGIFSDHAVVQRDVPVNVWGWADAGEDVSVSLGKVTASTKAGADGKWTLKLDAQPQAADGQPMTVKGKNALTVNDVLVGEVWLCSGQSNMGFTVNRADNYPEEQAAAKFPQIRMYQVARNPQPTVQNDGKGQWVVCSPDTVGTFSAAAYFFGRDIHQKLHVPVGLINSSYGGTDICAWTSEDVQRPVPELNAQFEDWAKRDKAYDADKAKAAYEKQMATWQEASKKAKADGKPAPRRPQAPVAPSLNQNRPSNLFNGMIAPLIPYTIRGAIWYQGENNAGSDERGVLYAKQLPLMIADWRKRWGYEFPFGIVQLPNFTHKDQGWMLVQEAELKTAQTVPNTGLAVTIDLGNPKDIHPTHKQEVGHRLANWALGDVYKQPNVASSGPWPKSHEVRGNEVVVTFTHADGGLAAKGGELKGFELAGADGKFVPAAGKIDGDKVIVSSPEVAKPVAIRYAWKDNPDCNLANAAGIPASPFRFEK